MSDNGAAYVPRSEFDFFQREFHDLKTDTTAQFVRLEGKMDGQHSAIMARLDTFQTSGGSSLETLLKWLLPVVIVLGTAIGALVKMNIDTNVQDVGERISSVDKNLTQAMSMQNSALSSSIAMQGDQIKTLIATTIPRAELEYRINANRDAIKDVTETQQDHSGDIASVKANADNLKADVERLKGDIVTRKENESHWEDLQNRFQVIVGRVNDLQKESAGASLGEQLQGFRSELSSLRNEINQLQGRFLVTPDSGSSPQSKP